MKGSRGTAIAAALTIAMLAFYAPGAAAATEVGNACEANVSVVAGYQGILFPLVNGPASAIPASAPVAGIATRWTARQRPGSGGAIFQRLKVLRLVPGAKQVQVVAESPLEGVASGRESFPVRLSVQAGDRFGLSGPLGSLACSPASPGDVAGGTVANGPVGSTEAFYEDPDRQVAVSVTVEPDGDGDGYGDETQDGCPWNAALQAECPPVTPKVDSVAPKRRAILVKVGVSSQAQVQVFGQVSWQVRQKAGQGAGRARKGDRGLTVGLSAGAPRTVLPGTVASFRVPLRKAVLRRLGRLAPAQALKAQITIRTTDLAGRENDRLVAVKLRGRRR